MKPEHFIITRKRKKYRFARFADAANCFEIDNWTMPATDKPITLEVGAGTALFSVEMATRHPERFYIALDVKADRLQKGAYEALDRGLTNVQFVRIHAMQLDERVSLKADEIWVTFPDPHPKKRSAKHRLLHPLFLQQYRNILDQRGKLLFKTDNHALFDWSLEQLVTHGWHITALTYDLHSVEPEVIPENADARIKTTYEVRFTTEGLPTHFLVALPDVADSFD